MALRRTVKNVVKNFTDIEVKVREATSNDPWGPSSSLTSEIADATYNVQAFTEIMTLLWKRINDHGKNWRHVYKSLVVLDYIVKTGSERVAQQCKENIFAIKTLKDFQFIDKDGKDQGVNVREKSKALVALVKDEERLKAERQRALKAKERFSQSQGGIGNTNYPKNRRFQATTKYPEARGSMDDSNITSRPTLSASDKEPDSQSTDGRIDSEIEKVRPSNQAEEEMQLQIALAMSREEAEHDQRTKDVETKLFSGLGGQQQPQSSTLLNLTDPNAQNQQSNSNDPWGIAPPPQPAPQADPWSAGHLANPPQPVPPAPSADPWGSSAPVIPPADPWGSSVPAPAPAPVIAQASSIDPWETSSSQPVANKSTIDPFASQNPTPVIQETSNYITPLQATGSYTNSDPFGGFGVGTNATQANNASTTFLSNGSHLVDVDNILSLSGETKPSANPFMTTTTTNPFQQDKPKPKSMNEMRHDKSNAFVQPTADSVLLPTPMQPSQNNPFL